MFCAVIAVAVVPALAFFLLRSLVLFSKLEQHLIRAYNACECFTKLAPIITKDSANSDIWEWHKAIGDCRVARRLRFLQTVCSFALTSIMMWNVIALTQTLQ